MAPIAQPQILFTLSIPPYTPTNSKPTPTPNQSPPSLPGDITLTLHSPQVYVLTFSSPPDNRLTPPFLSTLNLALSILQHSPHLYPPGVLLLTSRITKFFSNGLDYESAISDPKFMQNHLYPVWRKLLSYPMPTVAVMNGHAFAGGLMTAMACDYRLMNPHRGYLCLNELEFGAELSPGMAALFRIKLPMAVFRTLVLEAKRFAALAALEAGIVDGVGGVEEAVKLLEDNGVLERARQLGRRQVESGGKVRSSYGAIKEEMYKDIIAELDNVEEKRFMAERREGRRQREEHEKRMVEEWSRGQKVRSKL